MKKQLLLLSLCSLLYSNNNSSDFSIILNNAFNSSAFDITQDYNGNISAVGFSNSYKKSKNMTATNAVYSSAFDYLDSISSNRYGYVMNITTIDKDYADIVLSKDIKLNSFAKAVSVVKTADDGYFIGGYTLSSDLVLARLDSRLNTIYIKKFGTKNFDKLNRLISLRDGGVIALATSRSSRDFNDNIFENGIGKNDISITRFSKDGYILWSKKYGSIDNDFAIDIVEEFDNTLVVLYSTKYKIYLMKLNENGDKTALKEIVNSKDIKAYRLSKLNSGNFIVSLSITDEMGKKQIKFMKFDYMFNTLIDRTINTTYSSVIRDIKEFKNSNLMAVGYVEDSYNRDGLSMLLDRDLTMLNQEHFGDDNFDEFNSLYILDNSEVVVAGRYTPQNSQESKMWILKLNKNNELAKKKVNHRLLVSDSYKQLRAIFKDECDKKILKISKDLEITFLDKRLLFATGQYELNKTQKLFLKDFSKKLIDFLVKNRDKIKGLEVSGHTSSEWGRLDFSKSYIKNLKLSMQRAYSVVSFIFNRVKSKENKRYFIKILQGSFNSYSKKIIKNSKEDKQNSRRVSFKILLK